MVTSITSNAWEFGKELTKAVGKQSLAIAPFVIGSKLSQLAGYAAPYSTLMSGFSNCAILGSALSSGMRLIGRSSSEDTSVSRKVKDVLNVAAGAAIVANVALPCAASTVALGATVALSGAAGLYSGMKQIKEGATEGFQVNWKKVSEGIVSGGMSLISLQSGKKIIASALETSKKPLLNDEEENPNKSTLPINSRCIYYPTAHYEYLEEEVQYKYVQNQIMKQDRSATLKSINDFFLSSIGYIRSGKNGNECIGAAATPTNFIKEFPEEAIKIFLQLDRNGNRMFKNYEDFSKMFEFDMTLEDHVRGNKGNGNSWFIKIYNYITGDITIRDSFDSLRKSLLDNSLSKFTRNQLNVMFKLSWLYEDLSNLMKNKIPNNPLVLQATEYLDFYKALGFPVDQTIRNSDDGCNFLKQAKQEGGMPVDFLTITGHGEPEKIRLSGYELEINNIEQLAKCIKENVSDNAKILLKSYSTGGTVSSGDNFAQALAIATGHEVIAPTEILSPPHCRFKFEEIDSNLIPKYTCINPLTGNSYIRTFKPDLV